MKGLNGLIGDVLENLENVSIAANYSSKPSRGMYHHDELRIGSVNPIGVPNVSEASSTFMLLKAYK